MTADHIEGACRTCLTDVNGSAGSAITAVLIVRDEAARLPDCLASLRGAIDAVFVLDTGSRDTTCALLDRMAADPDQDPPLSWSSRPFDDFSQSRTTALEHVATPFWLWIDADERLTPELANELAALRRGGRLAEHPLWLIPCRNLVRGRVMRSRSLAGTKIARLAQIGAVRPRSGANGSGAAAGATGDRDCCGPP